MIVRSSLRRAVASKRLQVVHPRSNSQFRGVASTGHAKTSRSSTRRLAWIAGGIVAVGATLFVFPPVVASAHADPGVERNSRNLLTSSLPYISMDEIEKHNSRENGIWVAIEGEVYALDEFVDIHPGGKAVIERNAGKDVTKIYKPVHPSNAIEENLRPDQHIGHVDPASIKEAPPEQLSDREKLRRKALDELPPVGTMLNLDDFENVAKRILTDQAWAYYASAADDEVTKYHNRSAFSRIWFKPRILRAVDNVSTSTEFLSTKVDLPVYISPAAMAKLGHPQGELNLTRAAGQANIIQGISANASVALQEILDARTKDQSVVYQLYVNRDRKASEKILSTLNAQKNIAAVMLTVDAAVMGNREADLRAKGEVVQTAGNTSSAQDSSGKGVGQAISGYIDPSLDWSIIEWYKRNCSLPLILKGVQTIEDVELAAQAGCTGVVLSNHGGRSLDFAPAPIDVLIDMRMKRPDLFDKIDVFIDGGVRRGTDVLKALALGAKGVGLGRPFLYAQSGFGQAGAARAIDILREEIQRDMRLLGVTRLSDLRPSMIDILPRSSIGPEFFNHQHARRQREYAFEFDQQQDTQHRQQRPQD